MLNICQFPISIEYCAEYPAIFNTKAKYPDKNWR